MLMIVAYIVLFIVALIAPAGVQLVLMAINFFLPDPLPFADELIQVAIFIMKAANE